MMAYSLYTRISEVLSGEASLISLMLCGLLALLVFFWFKRWGQRGMPPFVPGLPIVGNAPKLKLDILHRELADLGKTFGPVFCVRMGPETFVVAHSYDAIREVLIEKSSAYSGRPPCFRFDKMGEFDRDNFVLADSGKRFEMHKKKTMTALRMYGDGLAKLEQISLEYIDELIQDWKKLDGKGTDPRQALKEATAKIMVSIFMGDRIDDAEVKDFIHWEAKAEKVLNPLGKGLILDIMPWIRFLPCQIYKDLCDVVENFKRIFSKMRDARKMALEEQRSDGYEDPQGVVDKLILDMKKQVKDDKGDLLFNETNIRIIMHDTMAAGLATTAMTLYALVAILAGNQCIQDRIHKEIDDVIGTRKPSLADRANMHYTEACILEILRYLSQTALSIPHKAVHDTTLGGYRVPKGTPVWTNLWHMHHDAEFWENPSQFNPERFLDADGVLVPSDHPNRKRLMPFGAGRRVCLGESLAKNRIFLFVTCLLQEFSFHPQDKDLVARAQDISNYNLRFILQVPDYKVEIETRNASK